MTYAPQPLDRFQIRPPHYDGTPCWLVYDVYGLHSSKHFNDSEEQQAREHCRRLNAVYRREVSK